MDSDMEHFFNSIESENNVLTEKVTNLENEVLYLTQKDFELEKALDKQKSFHRKYAEEVEATEKIRIKDFKEEKRTLNEQIKVLVKQNRQQNIDCSFYKNAYEELAKEKEVADHCNERTANKTTTSPSTPLKTTKTTKTTTIRNDKPERKQKSSKSFSQISEKLLLENKKT